MADLTPIPMGIPWDPWDPSLPHSHAHFYKLLFGRETQKTEQYEAGGRPMSNPARERIYVELSGEDLLRY